MNRNLLKQIWNERRSNAFLWMELFVVFVILWYIVDVVYVTLSIYNLPMGFDIENTYVLRFERMTSKAAAYQPGRTMKEDNCKQACASSGCGSSQPLAKLYTL